MLRAAGKPTAGARQRYNGNAIDGTGSFQIKKNNGQILINIYVYCNNSTDYCSLLDFVSKTFCHVGKLYEICSV